MFFGQHNDDEDDWEDQQQQHQDTNPTEQANTTEFYQLLEIEKNATSEQIKKSFRKKALKEHPDKGGDPTKFKRLKEAYDTLLDPEKRQLYDDYGEQGVKNGGPPNKHGPFGGFGQTQNKPRKSKPKLIKLDITLQEVYTGCVKQVPIKRYRICTDCLGKGGHNSKKCDICKGVGVQIKLVQLGPGMYTQAQVTCQTCSGTGQIFTQQDKCKACVGKRVIESQKQLQVTIEQGVPDTHDYIFNGESDEYPNILAGDIYVRVNLLKHDNFERKGADLFYHKKITLLQALTGVTTVVNHLNGKQYIIATAPRQILANKDIKTIKRLGLPFYKDPNSFGNLHFQFTVIFPVDMVISANDQQLLRSTFNYKSHNQQIVSKAENACPLQQFSQQLLNSKAGDFQEQQQQGGQEGQGIPCQQQ